MAAGKAEIRGRRSLLTQLAIPRPITRIGLVILAVGLAQLSWVFLTAPLISYVSGVAAPFCLLCAGAIWSMRDKADMVLEGDHLRASEFKKVCATVGDLRMRSTWRAALVALCALLAASPAISQQLAGTMWHWMVLAAGLGVGESAYGFLLANAWEGQLRTYRNSMLQRAKDDAECASLIARLEASMPRQASAPADWSVVAGTLDHQIKPH